MSGEKRFLTILGNVGAVIDNSHIVYTSGKHGRAYVNKDALYAYPSVVAEMCSAIVTHFCDDSGIGVNFDVVVGPEKGGIILAQWAGYGAVHVQHGHDEILAVYAEKETVPIPDPENLGRSCFAETGRFVIKRGYDKLVTGKDILVVEDVLTTGGSVAKTVEAVRAIGGNVMGVGALVNRGRVTAEMIGGVPELYALLNIDLDAWPEEECPLCAQSVPINTDVGKGREYLARKKAS